MSFPQLSTKDINIAEIEGRRVIIHNFHNLLKQRRKLYIYLLFFVMCVEAVRKVRDRKKITFTVLEIPYLYIVAFLQRS